MRFILILTAVVLAMPAFAWADADMVVKRSPHTVAETVDRLQAVLVKALAWETRTARSGLAT